MSPNEKQEAFPEDLLLTAFLNLAIQLDRVPTDADMRLHRRSNAEFPSLSTFQKRFARRPDLFRKVVAFAATRDVPQNILNSMSASLADASAEDESDITDAVAIQGYVYLLKSGRRYKIGKTTSPLRRLGQIAIELPEKTEPIHAIETDDPTGIEAYWHNRFRDRRLNGEWFALTAADIRAFKRRRRFM